MKISQELGIGAQFGGKYFCHDVRVIRLPRHGASCPVGVGVSCSADRQVKGKVTPEGVFIEQLETDPSKYLPDVTYDSSGLSEQVVEVNLNRPMSEILNQVRGRASARERKGGNTPRVQAGCLMRTHIPTLTRTHARTYTPAPPIHRLIAR